MPIVNEDLVFGILCERMLYPLLRDLIHRGETAVTIADSNRNMGRVCDDGVMKLSE